MTKSDPIKEYANSVGTQVRRLLEAETCVKWWFVPRAAYLDFSICYNTEDQLLIGESWTMFDPRVPKTNDPLDYTRFIVEAEYNHILAMYKRNFGKVKTNDQSADDTRQRKHRSAKRGVKGN